MSLVEGFDIDEETMARGKKLFAAEARFVAGADRFNRIPQCDLDEIAFSGRSNVGKSSLLNALCGRRQLARTSSTPGRTQQINFFDLGGQIQLADLPGYGYAKVSKSKVSSWNDMVRRYLASRENLKRVCALVDGRHGVLEADRTAFRMLDDAGCPYIVVLTKADKIKPAELAQVKADVEAYLAQCSGAFPHAHVTSAEKGTGIAELRAILAMA